MTWTESFDNVHLVIYSVVVTNWVWVGSVSNRIGFQVNREEAYIGTNAEYRVDYWNPLLGNYENQSTFLNVTNFDEVVGVRLVALNGSIVNEKLFWRSDMVGILGTNANVPVTNAVSGIIGKTRATLTNLAFPDGYTNADGSVIMWPPKTTSKGPPIPGK